LLNEVAKVSQVVRGPEFAAQLLEDLLREADGRPSELPLVLRTKAQLAAFYLALNRNDDIRRLLESTREPVTKLYGERSVAMANWKNSMASFLDSNSNYVEALKFYHEALSTYQEVLGEKSGAVARMQFNIATAAESAEHWDEAEQYYRDSIQLASTVWPESNGNIEMFRAAYALFLNKRDRFAESIPLFRTVLSRADKNPEFRDDEVFKATELGLAIALYAVEPSKEHLAEFTRTTDVAADISAETLAVMRDQVRVAKAHGLPVPVKGPLANTADTPNVSR